MYKKIMPPNNQEPVLVLIHENGSRQLVDENDPDYQEWSAANTVEEVTDARAIPEDRQAVYAQMGALMASMGIAEPPVDMLSAVVAFDAYVEAAADAADAVGRLAQVMTIKTLRDYAVQDLGGSWAEGREYISMMEA